ncbi:MAG: hypothetical protein DRH56_01205 [Deltaproteobacteria bacterium]|nr:MAG: hypothetical protein DRH56_01205 [Deltaproteobacteria bacterium]
MKGSTGEHLSPSLPPANRHFRSDYRSIPRAYPPANGDGNREGSGFNDRPASGEGAAAPEIIRP